MKIVKQRLKDIIKEELELFKFEQLINKEVRNTLKEVTGGSVVGFVGRGGRDIDALFAGAFHPDSGHGSENKKILDKQLKDRNKDRKDMEQEASKDNIELVGVPSPPGGHFADIGETEGVELAYGDLDSLEQIHRDFNEQMTPKQDLEWIQEDIDLEYDESGEAYKVRDITYDNKPLYADENFTNYSETNWKYISRGDK